MDRTVELVAGKSRTGWYAIVIENSKIVFRTALYTQSRDAQHEAGEWCRNTRQDESFRVE